MKMLNENEEAAPFYDACKELDEYRIEHSKKCERIWNTVKRVMQPHKYRRLMKGMEIFKEDCWITHISLDSKPRAHRSWNEVDSDIPYFRGLGPRLDQSCGYSGDDYHGVLSLRITKSRWLNVHWSM